jgi:cation diffusion facilitator CzcD-associated flavoprotein CzcO
MTVHMKQVEAKAMSLGVKFNYNTTVTSIEKRPTGGWTVNYISPDGSKHTAQYDKLVCASGSFSSPSVPDCAHKLWKEELPEKVALPLVIHGQQLSLPKVQSVIEDAEEFLVVGASKSAMDAAERFALVRGLRFKARAVISSGNSSAKRSL